MGDVAALDQLIFKKTEENKRGIPEAIFIENVEEMCKDREPTEVVGRLQDLHSKYQYMQSSLTAQRSSLKTKLPDIVSALEVVNHLAPRLAENIWSKATAAPSDTVCLWLGANCMLEYKLDEAIELLQTNEGNARTTLKSLEEETWEGRGRGLGGPHGISFLGRTTVLLEHVGSS
eukprot:Skav205356  [mRNA]  locus=scaffold1956:183340:185935:- [translate_table: standard]